MIPRADVDRVGWRRAALLLCLLLPLGWAACGKRGPPVAPERRMPVAVDDLTASMTGEGVGLAWTLPRLRADRSPIREIRRVEVYRRLETGAPEEPPRPALVTFGGLFGGSTGVPGFERLANITVAEPTPPAEIQGRQGRYTDRAGIGVGQRYTYVVVAVDDQGRPSPPSNRVLVAITAAPGPPTQLSALAGDGQVRLRWEAPATYQDGSPGPTGLVYHVYRTTGTATPTRPLNAEPLTSPEYIDLAVQNDVAYRYTVRALLGPGGAASRESEPVTATPEDQTAPAQPRALVAVVVGRTIRLAWEPSPDADVAGYHVYRSQVSGRGHARLTTAPHPATTYTDGDVRPGETYHYLVTAVDRARRANESVPSAEASARLP